MAADDVAVKLAVIDDWLDDQDWSTQPSDATGHVRYLLDLRREERSWRGLLAFLDEYYPAGTILSSDHPNADVGARITWMARQIARVRVLHEPFTVDGRQHCHACNDSWEPWPCLTVRALDGEEK